jgi:hypothetical protein
MACACQSSKGRGQRLGSHDARRRASFNGPGSPTKETISFPLNRGLHLLFIPPEVRVLALVWPVDPSALFTSLP